MSDTSQGEGWWVASDKMWYPPELHADPDYRAKYAEAPGEPSPEEPASESPTAAEPELDSSPEPEPEADISPAPAPVDAPAPAPLDASEPDTNTVFSSAPPQAPPPVPPPAPDVVPERDRSGSVKWIVLGVGMLLAVGGALVALLLAGSSSNGNDEAIPTAAAVDDVSDTDSSDTDSSDGAEDSTDSGSGETSAEDGEETAGVGPDQDEETAPAWDPGGVGTADNPAGFDSTYVWPEWRVTITGLIDPAAANLVSEFSNQPEDGNEFVAVVWESIYSGPEFTGSSNLFLSLTDGDEEYETFGCFFDESAITNAGFQQTTFEFVSGSPTTQISCFEVPSDQRDNLQVTVESFASLAAETVTFTADGADLPEAPPLPPAFDRSQLDLLPFGTEVAFTDWTVSLREAQDAQAAGLLSDFGEPPADGVTYVVVTFDVSYNGDEEVAFIGPTVSAIGSSVYGLFGGCSLDGEALADAGYQEVFEFSSGQTALNATCLQVPTSEVDDVILRVDVPIDFAVEPSYYSSDS